MTADEIIQRMKQMVSRRTNFSNLWQECEDYGPGVSHITTQGTSGQARTDTFQAVGENSIVQLAAGLYSYMFPTDHKAFTLKVDNEELAENDNVKQWLHAVTDILHTHLIQSNFREAFIENLKSDVQFGTGCLHVERGKLQVLNFINFFMGNIYVDVDSRMNVDTVFRYFDYTARQAEQDFGRENLGPKVLKALDDSKRMFDKFKFIYATYPRKDADGKNTDPLSMDYAVIYVCEDDRKIVKESGSPEFPMQVSRFDRVADNMYGRGPMMKELPDIRMLSDMKAVRIKCLEKMADPTLVAPDDGSLWPLSTEPASVMYMTPGGEKPFWFEFKGDISTLNEAINDLTKEIKDGFFLGLFEIPEDRTIKTATEIMKRAEMKLRGLTPIVGRQQSEKFNPLIHRMIRILSEIPGALPGLPEELIGIEYSVEYLGKLALVLASLESEGLVVTMQQLRESFGEEDTGWMDNFDKDRISRDMARNNAVPANWLKDVDLRDEERQIRAEAEQKQRELEQAQIMAAAAKDGGKAPEKGSATERILNFGEAA